ncbi:unnamed protein product [Ranitomeya imitator]|uniref:Uncharacterized protein n=1 Tax=Ranitomeya imitator TaxID=111125 RepID=A0ABN9LW85_9NEOB|nr:unnamed protein product [Ranitomeya imitator]
MHFFALKRSSKKRKCETSLNSVRWGRCSVSSIRYVCMCGPLQTERFQLEVKYLIEEALLSGIIDQKLADYLIVEYLIVPILYTLPKIHKDLCNPPRCPIVSGRRSLLNKVAILLDRILPKFAMIAPSYTRDTSDFIRSLEDVRVDESTFLVSFNVVSLYTLIEHERGLFAVHMMLAGSDMAPECTWFTLALFEFILRRNYFLFGDDYYLHHCGTAMGSNVAPTYANIYMAVLEGEHVYKSPFWHIVRNWRRYVDNVSFV